MWVLEKVLRSGTAAAASWDETMVFERSAGAGRHARPGGRRATRGCELGSAHAALDGSEEQHRRSDDTPPWFLASCGPKIFNSRVRMHYVRLSKLLRFTDDL